MKTDIKCTEDYSIFKNIKGNRELNKRHIKNLVHALGVNKSKMKDSLAYNPILVNDKLEVIDGQHRLAAAKELAIPVYYIIYKGLELKDVQKLNSNTKSWNPMDYAKSYALLGYLNYQLYMDAADSYPDLNHDVLRYVLSAGNSSGGDFKQGKFHIWDVKDGWNFMEELQQVKPYFKHFSNRSFAFAFYKATHNPDYNHDIMMRALKNRGYTLAGTGSIPDYLRQIETIYNFNLKDKVRFF